MSRFLEIKELTPPAGMEHSPAAYPGNGAYLLPDGCLAIVGPSYTYTILKEHVPPLVNSAGTTGGCDANRLLDQVLALAGKKA